VTRRRAVIIGGGLAGSSCAIELRRRGVDVVAYERDAFPRRKVCGAFLSPGAVRSLADLGLLESVRAAGAVLVRRASVQWPHGRIEIPFDSLGLGFSRERLDWMFADAARVRSEHHVRSVVSEGHQFSLRVRDARGREFGVRCDVVVDAAGRLSRFTRRRVSPQYGVAFQTPDVHENSLEFQFFDGGYGGSVGVEGDRINTCFLLDKERVRQHLGRPGCIVTGPVGYRRVPGPYMAIGDAAGMIDPFSGEGMRLAMESGRLAAEIVGLGLDRGLSYPAMKRLYDGEWRRRWRAKRSIAFLLRQALGHQETRNLTLAMGSRYPVTGARLLRQLWA
jgi:flavin-dependent dehydrogenase